MFFNISVYVFRELIVLQTRMLLIKFQKSSIVVNFHLSNFLIVFSSFVTVSLPITGSSRSLLIWITYHNSLKQLYHKIRVHYQTLVTCLQMVVVCKEQIYIGNYRWCASALVLWQKLLFALVISVEKYLLLQKMHSSLHLSVYICKFFYKLVTNKINASAIC